MKSMRTLAMITAILIAASLAYLARDQWLPGSAETNSEQAMSASEEETPGNKIIIGEQAQKNLKLTAKPLQTTVFWKTISIPGMVVDRIGISDRQVVAPVTGIIHRIWHVPGDSVERGDVLFTLRLTSEPLHQAQTELYKATQDIALAEARRARLASAGEGIPQARLIEVENEIKRLQVIVEANRNELINRGLSADELSEVGEGKFVREIPIVVPPNTSSKATVASESYTDERTPARVSQTTSYQLQELKVEAGQQVQAGETLCNLADHRALAVEGKAFRDETLLLERSIKEAWPVEIDFQEAAASEWPPFNQNFVIQHIASTIDPVTRTFSFLVPLENQSKKIDRGDQTRVLWRFRPGQKVRLSVRVEKLEDVFVLPADAVVREGADAFVFTQNVNTFERRPVHLVYQDRDEVVLANDGSLQTYAKSNQRWTIAAVVRNAAPQLNRMLKAGGSSAVPKGYHIHADGSLHKNEDEGR